MGSVEKISMKLFHELALFLEPIFPELRDDLKMARMRISAQEYIARSIFIAFLVFLAEVPILSFIFGIALQTFLFSFIFSFTISILLAGSFFFLSLNYPKLMAKERAKKIEKDLPFATLFLSTIAGSKLPLYKILNIFSEFGEYGEVNKEILDIVRSVEAFGLDINTSLQRAIERTSSKPFKDLLWGMLSVNKTGGEMDIFLREKAKNFMEEYRRKLYEYSRQLMFIIEIYLTSIVLGAIFFTILTAIMGGMAGGGGLIVIQFLLIVVFIPLITFGLIFVIRSMNPGGE
ncbi:MAG: type II secretion system F family protein [Candidatus Aenigmatarchaeota archaeon]